MDQHHHQGWDWELLSDDDDDEEEEEEDGFLEGAQNQQQIYSATASSRMIPMPMVIYTMDYFICPPLHKTASSSNITPPQEQEQEEEEAESMEGKKQLMIHPPPAPSMNLLDPAVSQVSFKNIDQFVEIKVDSNNILPLANFQSPGKKLEEIVDSSSNNGEGGGRGFNIWKWGLSGIGAICSFGVATLCIVILSSHRHAKRRRIHPHLFTHHQRRITAATISFGGYYDDSSCL